MRSFALRFFIGLISAFVTSAAFAQGPTGEWMRGDGNARVQISRCGTQICAVNAWIRDRSAGESVGDRLVIDVPQRDATTMSGTAFDPKRNIRFAIEIKVAANVMSTRGCLAGGLVCRSMTWRRVN